jgi:hypothetical protein
MVSYILIPMDMSLISHHHGGLCQFLPGTYHLPNVRYVLAIKKGQNDLDSAPGTLSTQWCLGVHILPSWQQHERLHIDGVWGLKGMSSSCISVIGRGTVKLRCGKGRNLMLKDVLYVPQAALCLISVRYLANEDLKMMFNKTKFTIRNKSGKTITGGT